LLSPTSKLAGYVAAFDLIVPPTSWFMSRPAKTFAQVRAPKPDASGLTTERSESEDFASSQRATGHSETYLRTLADTHGFENRRP